MRPTPLLLCAALLSCTPAPYLVLQFPDAASEAAGAEVSVYALDTAADCASLMKTGAVLGWLLTLTSPLPLEQSPKLGKLPRGPTTFYAEVRDAAAHPYLRGCVPTSAGGEVLIPLRPVLRPLTVREGDVLTADVTPSDANGNPGALQLTGAPRFASWDASANRLRLAPGPADQGTYTFSLEPAADSAVFAQAVTVTVTDAPRPLKWDRLYRGWVGRFDAAALWDPELQQLYATGGRDHGVEIAKPSRTLFVESKPSDALTDFRVLAMRHDGGAPDWRPHTFTRSGTSGKYGHAMGWVRLGGSATGERFGFVLGGSDGAQVSGEPLLFRPSAPQTTAFAPAVLLDPGGRSYRLGMASAVEPDLSATYLYGGDLGQSGATPELLHVTLPSPGELYVTRIDTPAVPRPLPRSSATLTLALNPKRLVVIGGHAVSQTSETLYDDAWVICLEEAAPKCPPGSRHRWLRVTNPGGAVFPGSGTTGVFGHVAGYDEANDRVLTYGGLGVANQLTWLFEDVFALELGAAVPVDGGVSAVFRHLPPPGGPLGLVAAAATQDTDGGRLLIYGGITGKIIDGTGQLDMSEDVWALGLTPGNEKLTRIEAQPEYTVPARRVGASLMPRGTVLLGGQSEGADALKWPVDEWRIEPDGGATRLPALADTPLPLANMSVTYNPDLDEYWLYGGRRGNLLPTPAALFRYKPDAGYRFIEQPETNPRWGQASVWDELNHRLLCFGGLGLDMVSGNTVALDDVLSLRLETDGGLVTEPLAVQGERPPPRYSAIAGYDRAAPRLLVFGGTARIGTSEVDTVDVWELSLVPGQERWRQIDTLGAPADVPEGVYFPAGAWTHERPPKLYVIGTVLRQSGKYAFLDGVFRLELDGQPTWRKLPPLSFAPRPRVFPAFAFDERDQSLLIGAGASDPVFRNDVWRLTLP